MTKVQKLDKEYRDLVSWWNGIEVNERVPFFEDKDLDELKRRLVKLCSRGGKK